MTYSWPCCDFCHTFWISVIQIFKSRALRRRAGCSSWCPANSVKAWKAGCWRKLWENYRGENFFDLLCVCCAVWHALWWRWEHHWLNAFFVHPNWLLASWAQYCETHLKLLHHICLHRASAELCTDTSSWVVIAARNCWDIRCVCLTVSFVHRWNDYSSPPSAHCDTICATSSGDQHAGCFL